jgi:hypothetical protein
VNVEEIIDNLYGLPPTDFTRARNEAASELRKAGRRVEADRVKELRKPTAAAAAANRLVREHRADVEEYLRRAAATRDAQLAGKGDPAAAARQARESLERVTRSGGEAVRQSLLAAAVDEDAARELLAGRLDRELEPRGLGTLLAHVQPGAAPRPKRRSDARRPDDRAARAKLREATAVLTKARAAEIDAQERLAKARADVTRAAAAVERAQRELDRLQRG